MYEYHKLLHHVLENGQKRSDRTGTGTIGVFGTQSRYDLSQTFPLVTTKKIHWKSVVHELLWMIAGDTNIKYLNDNGVTIWDEWADKNGDLGAVYGKQWRRFSGTFTTVDQLAQVQQSLRNDPHSRRHIVSAWHPAEIQDMALPPCHTLFQFYVDADNKLSCQLYQRSCDLFLGAPFNIASYALLTCMMAHTTGLHRGTLTHVIGDAHIYLNHLEQVKLQLSRTPLQEPQLLLDSSIGCIFDFEYENIHLVDYNHYPSIKAPVAV